MTRKSSKFSISFLIATVCAFVMVQPVVFAQDALESDTSTPAAVQNTKIKKRTKKIKITRTLSSVEAAPGDAGGAVAVEPATETSAEGVVRKKATTTNKRFSQVHLGYQMWQESIDATTSGISSTMLTHFYGMRIGYSSHRPRKNVRWVDVYGVDLGLGVAKGTAAAPLSDEVSGQPWISLTAYPGRMYRSTSKSELGLLLPVSYRLTQWELQPPFELDRKSAFAVGVTALYVNRFSLRTSFSVALTHQFLLDATVLGIGYQVDFR